jgi:DNA-binding NtrC family response regulator
MDQGRIYVCDEDRDSGQYFEKLLGAQGHQVTAFANGGQMLQTLAEAGEERPDLVLLDARLPGPDGLETLRRIKALRPETAVIVLSAFATVRCATDALKLGACDYLAKPVLADELTALVAKEVGQRRLVEENRSLKAQIRKRFDPDQVVFKSALFKNVFDLARKVAPSDAGVLVLGESGTGKELIASTLHYSSRRREQRFLTINCAALTDTLLESQLFGHLKGAFTGAVASQRGLVEEADRGTLFLDEIGDISPALQAKLLRVLQEKEFIPVGSTRVRHADVRFVAATNRDLEADVAAGRFREDLYYRLNVVTLRLPPLRERREDIPLLVEHFLGKFAPRGDVRVTPEALARLQGYDWPGNVRELENVIEMAVIFAEGGVIGLDHLPVKVAEGRPVAFNLPQEQMTMADLERRYIEQVYRQTRFHKVRTAQILDISRKTLDRKLQQYHIARDDAD